MVGQILQAVLDETQELLSGTGAMVIFKTDFLPKNLPDNNGNFILLAIEDASESLQFPGGLTQMNWKFSFNSYNYSPDAYNDDKSGYSTSLLNFVDTIRQHFSLAGLSKTKILPNGSLVFGKQYTVYNGTINYNGSTFSTGQTFTPVADVLTFTSSDTGYVYVFGWLTPGMANIFDVYGFQFTLEGVTSADPVDQDGIILGYKIAFDSTSLDNVTLYTEDDVTLITVTQVGNPPFSPNEPIS